MLGDCRSKHANEFFKVIADYISERYGQATWILINNVLRVKTNGNLSITSLVNVIGEVFGESSQVYREVLRLLERICDENEVVLE